MSTILNLPIPEIIEEIKKEYGLIHKSTAAEIHGIKGFLIWDYIIFNEITFKDMDGKIVSLYRGFSDQDTEKCGRNWPKSMVYRCYEKEKTEKNPNRSGILYPDRDRGN